MPEYAVTIPQRWNGAAHPIPEAHPDGWIAIEARSFSSAERIARRLFGPPGVLWCDIVDLGAETVPLTRWFPAGELARWAAMPAGGKRVKVRRVAAHARTA